MDVKYAMYAHIDMNSYFASVEQQANPHLRGRPLGVCAYLHKNGCVIAASIEAKQQGVKVGMSMSEAKIKCPDMKFVQNDPPKYRAVTSRVFALLHELTDRVEHYSIDEAFLDFTNWYRDSAEVAWVMCRTRLRIQEQVGEWLKCSVGIAPSKFLAKLASDMEKPNGLVIITSDNLDNVLSSLDLEDAWGIGGRIKKRLNRLGIFTLLDLKHYPLANLMRALGKAGWLWHERLRGRDVDRFEQADKIPPKSIGHSFCVPRRANDSVERILAILIKLTERAGRRLRSFELLSYRMEVQISFWSRDQALHSSFFGGRIGRMDFNEPVNDIFSLVDGATQLLGSLWDGCEPVSFLAVTLMDFTQPSGQRFLPFAESDLYQTGEKQRLVSMAVDKIRDRYGEESIVFSNTLGLTGDYAPDRIGFRKVEIDES